MSSFMMSVADGSNNNNKNCHNNPNSSDKFPYTTKSTSTSGNCSSSGNLPSLTENSSHKFSPSHIRSNSSASWTLHDNPLVKMQGKKWNTHNDFESLLAALKRHHDILASPTAATFDAGSSALASQKSFSCINKEYKKLNGADMHHYGVAPKREAFVVSICNICNAILKPPGLERHMRAQHRSSLRGALAASASTSSSQFSAISDREVNEITSSGSQSKTSSSGASVVLSDRGSHSSAAGTSLSATRSPASISTRSPGSTSARSPASSTKSTGTSSRSPASVTASRSPASSRSPAPVRSPVSVTPRTKGRGVGRSRSKNGKSAKRKASLSSTVPPTLAPATAAIAPLIPSGPVPSGMTVSTNSSNNSPNLINSQGSSSCSIISSSFPSPLSICSLSASPSAGSSITLSPSGSSNATMIVDMATTGVQTSPTATPTPSNCVTPTVTLAASLSSSSCSSSSSSSSSSSASSHSSTSMSLLSTTVVVAPSPSPTVVTSPVTFSNPAIGSGMQSTTTHMVSTNNIKNPVIGIGGKGTHLSGSANGYKASTSNVKALNEFESSNSPSTVDLERRSNNSLTNPQPSMNYGNTTSNQIESNLLQSTFSLLSTSSSIPNAMGSTSNSHVIGNNNSIVISPASSASAAPNVVSQNILPNISLIHLGAQPPQVQQHPQQQQLQQQISAIIDSNTSAMSPSANLTPSVSNNQGLSSQQQQQQQQHIMHLPQQNIINMNSQPYQQQATATQLQFDANTAYQQQPNSSSAVDTNSILTLVDGYFDQNTQLDFLNDTKFLNEILNAPDADINFDDSTLGSSSNTGQPSSKKQRLEDDLNSLTATFAVETVCQNMQQQQQLTLQQQMPPQLQTVAESTSSSSSSSSSSSTSSSSSSSSSSQIIPTLQVPPSAQHSLEKLQASSMLGDISSLLGAATGGVVNSQTMTMMSGGMFGNELPMTDCQPRSTDVSTNIMPQSSQVEVSGLGDFSNLDAAQFQQIIFQHQQQGNAHNLDDVLGSGYQIYNLPAIGEDQYSQQNVIVLPGGNSNNGVIDTSTLNQHHQQIIYEITNNSNDNSTSGLFDLFQTTGANGIQQQDVFAVQYPRTDNVNISLSDIEMLSASNSCDMRVLDSNAAVISPEELNAAKEAALTDGGRELKPGQSLTAGNSVNDQQVKGPASTELFSKPNPEVVQVVKGVITFFDTTGRHKKVLSFDLEDLEEDSQGVKSEKIDKESDKDSYDTVYSPVTSPGLPIRSFHSTVPKPIAMNAFGMVRTPNDATSFRKDLLCTRSVKTKALLTKTEMCSI